jgi:hypothetical protein
LFEFFSERFGFGFGDFGRWIFGRVFRGAIGLISGIFAGRYWEIRRYSWCGFRSISKSILTRILTRIIKRFHLFRGFRIIFKKFEGGIWGRL